MHWLLLAAAIVAEIIATTLLKVSAGFTKPLPSMGTVLGYALSFYMLSLVLKYVPVSMAYAIWAAAGTIAIAVVGVVLFSERLTAVQLVGILVTAAGVAMIKLGAGSVETAPTEVSSLGHQIRG